MKKLVLILAACFLLALFTGCGQEKDLNQAIKWTEPTIEQFIREFLQRPEGDILPADLDSVESVYFSDEVKAVNGIRSDGSPIPAVPWDFIYPVFSYKATGATLDCADFQHFHNLKDLTVLGYDTLGLETLAPNACLTSLTLADYTPVTDDPILAIKSLTSLSLISSDITDASPLANLPDLAALEISAASGETYGANIYRSKLNLASLSKLPTVEELTLKSCGLTETDIPPIFALPGLTHLNLAGNDISSLAGIQNLSRLDTLVISPDDFMLEVDVRPVSSAANLTHLALESCNLTDLKFLAKMTNLDCLSLNLNNIEDVEPLSHLTGLTYLDLSYNCITDVAPLRTLTNLTLALDDNSAKDKKGNTVYLVDISPLAPLANLREFSFVGSPVFPDCSALVGWSKLTKADFRGTWVGLSNLGTVRAFANLKTLRLGSIGNRISALKAENLQGIASLAQLEELDLSLCPRLSDLSALANLKNLTHLNAAGCRFTDLAPLRDLTQLVNLNLTNTYIFNIANDWTADITALSNLANLQVLDLSTDGQFNTLGDLRPLGGLTQLRQLELGNVICGDLSPLEGLKELRLLNLTGAHYGTPAVLDALEANGCRVIGKKTE